MTPIPYFYIKKVIKIKILSFDQSTKLTGVSLFQDNNLIKYELLQSDDKNSIERMKNMYDEFKKTIKKYKPDFIVFEQVQFQNNYGTFQQLSQLQGVLMAHLFEKNIGFQMIEPSAWRSYLGIKGRKREEQKSNAIEYIKRKYKIEVSEDIAEAICIGTWAINNIKDNELQGGLI